MEPVTILQDNICTDTHTILTISQPLIIWQEAIKRKKEIILSTVTEKSSSVVNTSPTIVLNGCNFTGCSLNFTGGAVGQAKRDVIEEKYVAQNSLEGLDLDDIFED